jgi:hypothetical protein
VEQKIKQGIALTLKQYPYQRKNGGEQMIDNKTIFISGCGSLAKALTTELLLNHRPQDNPVFAG